MATDISSGRTQHMTELAFALRQELTLFNAAAARGYVLGSPADMEQLTLALTGLPEAIATAQVAALDVVRNPA